MSKTNVGIVEEYISGINIENIQGNDKHKVQWWFSLQWEMCRRKNGNKTEYTKNCHCRDGVLALKSSGRSSFLCSPALSGSC